MVYVMALFKMKLGIVKGSANNVLPPVVYPQCGKETLRSDDYSFIRVPCA